jgi:hypothetical protein
MKRPTRPRTARTVRPAARKLDRPPIGDDAEARLARRIRAWAETWRRCPLNACRRHGACTRDEDCRGVARGPVVFTEAEKQAIRRALYAAGGRRVRYDGDARERMAPMPPAPPRA